MNSLKNNRMIKTRLFVVLQKLMAVFYFQKGRGKPIPKLAK